VGAIKTFSCFTAARRGAHRQYRKRPKMRPSTQKYIYSITYVCSMVFLALIQWLMSRAATNNLHTALRTPGRAKWETAMEQKSGRNNDFLARISAGDKARRKPR